MEKNFQEWLEIKPKINKNNSAKYFKEREIWWCCLGCNVGDEEDGKSNLFSRPVLIIKKFNQNLLIGIPISSKLKLHNPYYIEFKFKYKKFSALISQIRVFDSKRFTNRIGIIDLAEFNKVKMELKNLF